MFASHFFDEKMHILSELMTVTLSLYHMGFDLGTSGARISVIQKESQNQQIYAEVYSDSLFYDQYDDPLSWTNAIENLLSKTPTMFLAGTKSICVSGTSASCLLVDSTTGKVSRKPKMYDYDITHARMNSDPVSSLRAREWIDQFAPANHTTRAATSALSKLLHYHADSNLQKNEVLAHQSEYVANAIFLSQQRCGAGDDYNRRRYTSDWHNALKLGYDVRHLNYPSWLTSCLEGVGINYKQVLPDVVAPGQVIGQITDSCAKKYGIASDCVIVGGTTDSNAAFIAAAASSGGLPTYGTAVTSLGSTLAIKMLSKTFVEDSTTGVYSHRFPILGQSHSDIEEEAWLVGGASNVGCAVLRQESFSNEELVQLSRDMDVSFDSETDYYPLTKTGERFPVADGAKEPILEPKLEDRTEYLKAILQGITKVEQTGFQVFARLGCHPTFPSIVQTCGGGSKNEKWIQMRQRWLQTLDGDNEIKVMRANNAEASFGAAILAASSFCRE